MCATSPHEKGEAEIGCANTKGFRAKNGNRKLKIRVEKGGKKGGPKRFERPSRTHNNNTLSSAHATARSLEGRTTPPNPARARAHHVQLPKGWRGDGWPSLLKFEFRGQAFRFRLFLLI
ncbi:hypothetical protein OUZ56_009154 [Daphnia magna]|uniref:Uncharacterized protein n=1 Tax=Daphnia magna TaxID=35525 RepID=A0ABR0AFF4_9CRUS|nr:hypothetical protein OUZ56_009154 [Daphnia magna]